MNINKDNYEIWFLDYAEGNLTETQLNELKSFVEEHPDLKVELESFEVISLDDVENVFPDKELLKKKGNSRTDDFIAYHEGDLNEAERKEIDQFISKNPKAKIEFDQLAKIYLEPDLNIQYSSKSDLQKKDLALSTDDFIAYHEGDLNEQEQRKLLAFLENNEEQKVEFDRLSGLYLIADGNIVFPNKANLKKKEGVIIFLNWQYIAAAASILLVLAMFFFQNQADNNDNPIVKNEEVTPVIKELEEKKEDIQKLLPIENTDVEQNIAHEPENTDEAPVEEETNENIIPKPLKKSPTNLADNNPSDTNQPSDIDQESIKPKTKNENKGNLPKIMESKAFKSIAIETNKPLKLKGDVQLEVPELTIEDEDNLAQANTQDTDEPITVLAFVEQKAANIVSDDNSNKLKLFDVIKKVGEKSRLYNLDEKDDNKFSLKIAKLELEGKRKKVTL